MATMVKWIDGTSEFDFDTIPQASREGILSRCIGHFRNELASAALGWAKGQVAGEDGKASAVSSADAAAYRDSHVDEAKTFGDKWMAAKLQAIQDGKLGVRTSSEGSGGVDPLTREMHKIAIADLTAMLEAHGLKMPRGEDKLTLRGVEHSRGSLVSAKLAKDGDAIEKKAKANLAAKAKTVASHKETDIADALGL